MVRITVDVPDDLLQELRNKVLSNKELRDRIFSKVVDQIFSKEVLTEALELWLQMRRGVSLIKTVEDPILRAKMLKEALVGKTIRSLGREIGISHSTLSEWLKVLDLSEKMQTLVKKGIVPFSHAITLVKMKLSADRQDKLADAIEKEGIEALKREIEQASIEIKTNVLDRKGRITGYERFIKELATHAGERVDTTALRNKVGVHKSTVSGILFVLRKAKFIPMTLRIGRKYYLDVPEDFDLNKALLAYKESIKP